MNFETAKNIINLTHASYNNIATSFSDSRSDNWPEVENLVKEYAQDSSNILDLGCGNGRLIQLLKIYKNINYTGLDNSEKLIVEAKKKYAFARRGVSPRHNLNINFISDNILNLNQFESNSFDTIFMIASFNHIPSQELQEKVMANLYRILKKDGTLVMTNWNLWNINNKKNIWQYKFKKKYKIKNFSYKLKFKDVITLWQNKYPLYYHAFTLKELKKLFIKTGFKILKNKYMAKNKSAHWWSGWNIISIGEK